MDTVVVEQGYALGEGVERDGIRKNVDFNRIITDTSIKKLFFIYVIIFYLNCTQCYNINVIENIFLIKTIVP